MILTAWGPMLGSLAVWLLCLSNGVLGARYNVMGSQDEVQEIRLKSQYDLEPGTILSLPIDVEEETITLYGLLPPRLVSIGSSTADGIYSSGDTIYIDMMFTSEVEVVGSPTLTLNTGCSSSADPSSCTTKEIQSFICKADTGAFGLQLEDQYINNIYVNTTQENLKMRLEQLDGINEVTV